METSIPPSWRNDLLPAILAQYPSLITLVGVKSKSFIQSRSLQFSCLNVAEEQKSQQAMLLAFSLASVTEEGYWEQFPNVKLVLQELTTTQQEEALQKHQIEVGFVIRPSKMRV